MNTQIPEGYKQDAKGNLVPVANIKQIDLEKDELILNIVSQAKLSAKVLSDFKEKSMKEIQSFVELSADKYGVKIGRIKGNVQLVTFDGKYKVLRAMSDSLTFDEKLLAAKELIDECLRDWSEGARDEIRIIINSAFDVDKKGKVNTAKILELRRYSIEDVRWKKAMRIIDDSITVEFSKAYIRVYERLENGEYKPISLDVASV